jgi:hypothetical protein
MLTGDLTIAHVAPAPWFFFGHRPHSLFYFSFWVLYL